MTLRRLAGVLLLFVLFVGACGSGGNQIAAPSAEVDEDVLADSLSDTALPIVGVYVDEDGPATPQEMFAAASQVMDAVLIDVIPGVRYYGPSAEAPDAVAFEQVGLVFEPVETLSGDGGEVVVQWRAYTVASATDGAERLMRVEISGLVVNESDIGERFAVFVGHEGSSGAFELVSGSGLLRLNEFGEITTDGQGVFGEAIGLTLAESVGAS